MNRKVTTDEAAPRKFAPHGRVEYQALDGGSLLHAQCQGPFDGELVEAIREVQDRPEFLRPERKVILEFSNSCLGIQEFVDAISKYLAQLKKQNNLPKGVALVMSEEIEGANLMKGTYLGIYERLDVPAQSFNTTEKAIEWLNSL